MAIFHRKYSYIYIYYAVFIIFWLYIAIQVPYTGDDWDWGLDIGLQHLFTADINSRYAGNFLAVIMTRSKFLQTSLMGLAYLLIPFLMSRIASSIASFKHKHFLTIFTTANILLLSIDSTIWQQTYGWISGFANYGFSTVLLVVYFYSIQPIFQETAQCQPLNLKNVFLFFSLGLILGLFIENLTISIILITGFACLFSCLRYHKICGKYLSLFAGNLIGLSIMFSSSIYSTLFQSGRTLGEGRQLSCRPEHGIFQMLLSCIDTFANRVAAETWENNVVICCCISLLLILLLMKDIKKPPFRKTKIVLIFIDILAIFYFIFCSHLRHGKYFLEQLALLPLVEVVVNVGFFLIVALQIILLYHNRKRHMLKLLFLWFSAPLVVLPLSAVIIDGGRFYITSCCLLIIFILHLLDDYLSVLPSNVNQIILAFTIIIALCIFSFYFSIYYQIGICTGQRLEIIEQAKQTNAAVITLPSYPDAVSNYIWWGNPGPEYRHSYFREFYGLEPNTKLIFKSDE